MISLLVAFVCQAPPDNLFLGKEQDASLTAAVFEFFSLGAKYQSGVKAVSWRRSERADAASHWHVSENVLPVVRAVDHQPMTLGPPRDPSRYPSRRSRQTSLVPLAARRAGGDPRHRQVRES